MLLNELLINYRHLPIVEHILDIDEDSIHNYINIEEIQNEKVTYRISGSKEFCSVTGALSASILLNHKFLLTQMECGCLENYRKKQCVHTTLLYALALRCLRPNIYNSEISKYQQEKLTIEQQQIINRLASDLKTTAAYFQKIHLTAEITNERGLNFLSFRIGYGKEYMIRNISEFIDNMENNKFYSYGQKLSFVHSYDVLDEESKNLYSFLLEIYTDNSFKSIKLKKSQFLTLIELCRNSGFYYTSETKKTFFYTIEEVPSIDIALDEFSLHLVLPCEADQLLCGLNFAYFIGETKIYAYHFKKRNEAIIFNALFKSKDSALWIENNKTDFISNLLPILKNEIKIADSFYKRYPLPQVNILSFLSYQNDVIINHPKIEVEDQYRDTPYVSQILDNYSQYFEALGFKRESNSYLLENLEDQFNFLQTDLSSLKNFGDVFFDPSIKRISFKKSTKVHINISYHVGLLDFKLEGKELTIEEIQKILQAYRDKKHFVKLKNDIIAEVKEEDIKDISNFLEDFNVSISDLNSDIKKPLNYILKMVGNREDFIHCDQKIYKMIENIENFKKSKELPSLEFLKILRPYQIEAFQWLNVLASYGFGGILADDMGLGKTLEIISFIANDAVQAPTLIVCPMSLVYNWENECVKWNLKIPVQLIIGNAQERENIIKNLKADEKSIYITSYDSLRRDIQLFQTKFRCVVADEAQYIKNQHALKSAAIKQIQAELHFALTGTPIENGLADLWSIFDYLMPGYLSNYHHFKTRYESLIIEDDEEALQQLKNRVQPFILRRTKKDVLKELPAKIEEIYYCKLEDKQKELYDAYVQKIKIDLQESGSNILSYITRLRQICLTPELFYEDEFSSSKLALALELITRAIRADHRILVFSQFASVFPILGGMLENLGIPYFTLDGTTHASKRMELVNDFNHNNQVKVFMISLKAGGTGLNLIGADMVIHLDPWWNVSAENQATDRAYRIGQTKNVHVLKLICKNTIEEKVILLQNVKKELAQQIVLSQGEKVSLTKDDILDLIS